MFARPSEGRITSPFGMRINPVKKIEMMHWGVDFGKDAGTRIVAAEDGVVVRARNAETDDYGKLVIIEHTVGGKLYSTVYAHLASINIKEGQRVKRCDTIGVMGMTGASTGVHLHFEVHIGKFKYGNSVDPMLYIVDPHIKEVQSLLIRAGFNVSIDGILGKQTFDAIISFQKKCGLVADGIAGVATLAKLNEKREVVAMEKTRFSDVPKNHTAYNALERLSEAGIVSGYEDGTFRPNEPITRSHVAVILDKALNAKG